LRQLKLHVPLFGAAGLLDAHDEAARAAPVDGRAGNSMKRPPFTIACGVQHASLKLG
jgi:hypothetical protein